MGDAVAMTEAAKQGPGKGWWGPAKGGTHVGAGQTGSGGGGGSFEQRLGDIKDNPGTVLSGDADQPDKTVLTYLHKGFPADTRLERAQQSALAKNETVTQLSEDTDIPYDDVNAIVGQWATSSNDNDMRSLALQADAAKMLGVELPEWQAAKIAEIDARREAGITKLVDNWDYTRAEAISEMRESYPSYFPLQNSTVQQNVLRTMYMQTQARFDSEGVGATIRLRRGMTVNADTLNRWTQQTGRSGVNLEGSRVSYRGSVMESWSSEGIVASSFAGTQGPRTAAVVFEMDIPRARLIGTARTGFGCLGESEFVHLGAFNDETARLVEVRPAW